MQIPFYKYHGCGNDFILVDNRELKLSLSTEQITQLCDRRFGIGSDGIILIEPHADSDYYMQFYNPDGSQSFCGNGSRCALHFSHELEIVDKEAHFHAIDGEHSGILNGLHASIHMGNVHEIEIGSDYYYLNTGSPHYVVFVEDLDSVDVYQKGREIRYNDRFRDTGTNVNFVEVSEGKVRSRVYERGVENETYSSGTGTTAQALSTHLHEGLSDNELTIQTKGGAITISYRHIGNDKFDNIWLKGEVTPVYQGQFEL